MRINLTLTKKKKYIQVADDCRLIIFLRVKKKKKDKEKIDVFSYTPTNIMTPFVIWSIIESI